MEILGRLVGKDHANFDVPNFQTVTARHTEISVEISVFLCSDTDKNMEISVFLLGRRMERNMEISMYLSVTDWKGTWKFPVKTCVEIVLRIQI